MEATTVKKISKPKLSPFSLGSNTEIYWETLSSKSFPNPSIMLQASQMENVVNLCHDLNSVGVIGSVLASQIYFKNDKKKLNILINRHILIKHSMVRNGVEVPLYTLGINGLMLINNNLEKSNYWKAYKERDVLSCLAFYKLYSGIKAVQPEAKVKQAEHNSPYISVISIRNTDFHVLVIKGNEPVIRNYFRYEKNLSDKKIIIIVEHLNQLVEITPYLKILGDLVRITTEHDLKKPFQEMFYRLENNSWVQTAD